jgi:hypothetical protein
MLANDTVNLLTLCPALSLCLPELRLPRQPLFQLLVLQLQLCCRLRDYGFRIIEPPFWSSSRTRHWVRRSWPTSAFIPK